MISWWLCTGEAFHFLEAKPNNRYHLILGFENSSKDFVSEKLFTTSISVLYLSYVCGNTPHAWCSNHTSIIQKLKATINKEWDKETHSFCSCFHLNKSDLLSRKEWINLETKKKNNWTSSLFQICMIEHKNNLLEKLFMTYHNLLSFSDLSYLVLSETFRCNPLLKIQRRGLCWINSRLGKGRLASTARESRSKSRVLRQSFRCPKGVSDLDTYLSKFTTL